MSPEELRREIEALEKKMLQHARDLEFEAAAKLRDRIHVIREKHLGIA
jgi:excinuclease ABC subunit B